MAQLAQVTPPTRSQRDAIVRTVGVLGPDVLDTVKNDNGSVLIPTTVLFFMRPLLSRIPILNGVAGYAINPVDTKGHNVGYHLQTSDVAIEGQYMAWWGVDDGTGIQHTPEFSFIISDHGPGIGSPIGVVADGISEWMPVSLDALRRDPRYGDRFLQRTADRAKRSVLGVSVAPDIESSYDPALIEYLSIRAAILLIPAAREHWARQHRTVMTQGPAESAVYPDMLAALTQLEIILNAQATQMLRDLPSLVPGIVLKNIQPMPASSADGIPRSTLDPAMTSPPRLGGPWGAWY